MIVTKSSDLIGSQADLNCNILDESGGFYGVTSQYESSENMTITCSTKVCSFGKQVVEKVEVSVNISRTRLKHLEKVSVCFPFNNITVLKKDLRCSFCFLKGIVHKKKKLLS